MNRPPTSSTWRRRLVAGAAGLGLLATAPTVLATNSAAAEPTAPGLAGSATHTGADGRQEAHEVTLITGDRVRLGETPDGRPTLQVIYDAPASGPVEIQRIGEDFYAIPRAAQRYLAQGSLDRELFNVSGLVEDGYDDAHGGIPLIAEYAARSRAATTVPQGSDVTLPLPSINGAALVADADRAVDFWADLTTPRSRSASGLDDGIAKLWLDGRVEGNLDVSVPLIGAPEAWAGGHDGTGATVAVLDSGADPEHPDIADALIESKSFVPGQEITDRNGHGTHVASTVLGSGAASAGANKGVAPGADLAVGKVLGDDGYGQDSWIIAGMEWAAARADVVNMSLGDDARHDQSDPLAQSLNRLSRETGALFVVAAGNSGQPGTVGSPGTADEALTVAATDDSDRLASFSSEGPRGVDDGMKPDLAAPGVGITAARSQYSSGSGRYKSMNGTSMATPHVAGAAAILAAAHPEWDNARIKAALMSSARQLDSSLSAYQVGTGRLDVPAALDGVDATGSVYFGKLAWGEPVPEPVTRTVRYHNDGDTPLTLDLAVEGDTGVTLSAPQVDVPAGGQVEVQATVDFADHPAPGHFLGQIVATGAAGSSYAGVEVARTTTGATREDERYDLDLTVLGADATGAQAAVTFYQYGTTRIQTLFTDPETGAAPSQRLEPGIYAASTWVEVPGRDGRRGLALLHQPHIEVTDSDQSIVLDASKADLVDVRTPRASVDTGRRVEWFHDSGVGGQFTTFTVSQSPALETDLYALPTGEVAGDRYAFTTRWSRSAPFLDLRADAPDRVPFTPTYQRSSVRLDGDVRLAGVAAGTGTPEEYAAIDAAGKAVVVQRDPAITPAQRAQAAEAAHAALLIVVNDGPGVLTEAAGSSTLPVVSVTNDQGAALLQGGESGALRIKGTADRYPDYGYDLDRQLTGGITGDLAWRPAESDLGALVDRVHDDQPHAASLLRADCPDYLLTCMVAGIDVGSRDERVTYVSAGTEWYSEAYHVTGLQQRDQVRAVRPGQRQTLNWFGITSPHQGPGYWASYGVGNSVRVNMPSAGGPGVLTGVNGSAKARLYQGDTLLREANSNAIQQSGIPAVEGARPYRFELDVTRDAELWSYSTKTHSSWTFLRDQADPRAELPLIQLGYDVPVDLATTAKAGRPITIGLSARHVDGALLAGTVDTVTLEVSYDEGATWKSASPSRDGEDWSAVVRPPAGAATVSLRTTAADDAGNHTEQEVIRAFGLR